MTTRLPSTGKPADGAASVPLCKTDDIFIIHTLFRRMYGEAPGLVRDVAAFDTARSEIVGRNIGELGAGLHTHHTGEDASLWDRLAERAPSCALHVDAMRAQHAEVATQLEAIDAMLPDWRATADPAQRDLLAAMLDRLRDTLEAHLGQEEREIVPVAQSVISQTEWDEMGEHGRAATPKDRLFVQLGLILDSVPSAKRDAWFKESVPAPVRVIYKLFGKRKYEEAMRELFPGRPIPTAP
jgi:hypothetical protein